MTSRLTETANMFANLQAQEALRAFDEDGNGDIDVRELQRASHKFLKAKEKASVGCLCQFEVVDHACFRLG